MELTVAAIQVATVVDVGLTRTERLGVRILASNISTERQGFSRIHFTLGSALEALDDPDPHTIAIRRIRRTTRGQTRRRATWLATVFDIHAEDYVLIPPAIDPGVLSNAREADLVRR